MNESNFLCYMDDDQTKKAIRACLIAFADYSFTASLSCLPGLNAGFFVAGISIS
jgi:ABC-type iron transport system FetAB permease component